MSQPNVQAALHSVLCEVDKLQRAANVYATLGEDISKKMRSESAPQIRVKLETISKTMKSRGAANFELRRLGDTSSKQFNLMSKVLGTFGLGAIPFSDSLVFVALNDVPTVNALTLN